MDNRKGAPWALTCCSLPRNMIFSSDLLQVALSACSLATYEQHLPTPGPAVRQQHEGPFAS